MNKKSIIVISTVAATLTLGAIVFFGFTPTGRRIITGYDYQMEKAGENNYENRKKVEETLRSYYASYQSDKLGYEQYKDSADEYYYNLAQSYKMRANSTATTYNEYFTKNSYVFKNNIPSDLPSQLEIIK